METKKDIEIEETKTIEIEKSSVEKPKKSTRSKKNKKSAAWEKDHKMVKGIFKFHEVPGGELRFPFIKYKGDSPAAYILKDGETCEVPYMVAKHLNEGGKYPIHKYAVDEEGKALQKVGQWVDRFSFQPIGFFDDDIQPTPNLVTVETVG